MSKSFTLLRSFSTDTQQQSPQASSSKQRGKLNKRFSFHQKQHQSVVKEKMEEDDPNDVSTKKSKSKALLTRRWSSLKQYETTTLSQQSLATGSSTVTSSNPSPQHFGGGSDVKKKWEVIEHYKGTVNGRDTVSSSLLAVSFDFLLIFTVL